MSGGILIEQRPRARASEERRLKPPEKQKRNTMREEKKDRSIDGRIVANNTTKKDKEKTAKFRGNDGNNNRIQDQNERQRGTQRQVRKYARKNTAISEKNTLEKANDEDDGIIIILERATKEREAGDRRYR